MIGTAPIDPRLSREAPPLQVRLLGAPALHRDGATLPLPRQANRLLLFVLAASQAPVRREWVQLLLWPDADACRSRRALTQALTQLKAALPVRAALGHDRERLWLDPGLVGSDVREVGRLSVRPPASRTTADLEHVAALVHGRFLDGVACGHRLELEEWLEAEAGHWERVHLEALAELCGRYGADGRTHEAIDVAHRYLRIEPLDERVHRQLIRLLAAAGDRSAAVRHYRHCARLLDRELGIAPEAATRETLARALGGQARVVLGVGSA